MKDHYSDLQVVPQEGKESFHNTVHEADTFREDQYSQQPFTEKKGRRICGLTVKLFWIVTAIVTVVVIAAAIGGGVGGSISSKNRPDSASVSATTSSSVDNDPSQGPITSASQGSGATSTVKILTSTTQNPQYTLLVDCPSSNWTVYTPPGTTQTFRKICQNAFNNDGTLGAVNAPTTNLDACIGLCAAYNVENTAQILAGSNTTCNAVCWRATIQGDDWPGRCFGFHTRNTTYAGTNTFVFGNDDGNDGKCSGAALIN